MIKWLNIAILNCACSHYARFSIYFYFNLNSMFFLLEHTRTCYTDCRSISVLVLSNMARSTVFRRLIFLLGKHSHVVFVGAWSTWCAHQRFVRNKEMGSWAFKLQADHLEILKGSVFVFWQFFLPKQKKKKQSVQDRVKLSTLVDYKIVAKSQITKSADITFFEKNMLNLMNYF